MTNSPNADAGNASTLTKFIVLVLLTVPAVLAGSAAFGALAVFGEMFSLPVTPSLDEMTRSAGLAGGLTLVVAYSAIAATLGLVFLLLPIGYFLSRALNLSGWLDTTLMTAICVGLAVLALLIVAGTISPFGMPALSPGSLDKSPEFWTYAIIAGAVCGLVYHMFTRKIKILKR